MLPKSVYILLRIKPNTFWYFTFLFLVFLMSFEPNCRYAKTVFSDVRDGYIGVY